jgi:hypothetical protein
MAIVAIIVAAVIAGACYQLSRQTGHEPEVPESPEFRDKIKHHLQHAKEKQKHVDTAIGLMREILKELKANGNTERIDELSRQLELVSQELTRLSKTQVRPDPGH